MGLMPTTKYLARRVKVDPARHITPAKTLRPVNLPCSWDTMAPAIGLVVRAATDIMAKSRPCRIPILRMGEIWAISAGPREIKAPDENPKNPAKSMSAALLDAGIQRARTRIAVKNETTTKVLYRPSLSDSMPGMIRPNKLENRCVSIHLILMSPLRK